MKTPIMNSSSRNRKAGQSQTQTPSENPSQEEQKCEEKGSNRDVVDFSCLPTAIVTEILSRVRIKTLFTCRLVCKSWAALISTPEFAQLHLSKSPTRCLINPLEKEHEPQRLHLINLECPDSLSNKLVFSPNINLPNVPLCVSNSCNGLVCMFRFISPESNSIFVCNPVLREYITLPTPPNITEPETYCECAFGFSHISNQYKVVLGSYDNSGNYLAQIYRLGEGSWRSIESVTYDLGCKYFNAFFNGALHWIGFCTRTPFICCFDFVNEEFRAVPEPSEFDQYERPCEVQMRVGVINENLSVCDFHCALRNRVVIWVMKCYGVRESWSKDFVITHMIYDNLNDMFEPIMVNGSGEILMIINNESIVKYDPKSGSFGSALKISGVSSEFHATAHVPSLISLKDVAKGENLKVL